MSNAKDRDNIAVSAATENELEDNESDHGNISTKSIEVMTNDNGIGGGDDDSDSDSDGDSNVDDDSNVDGGFDVDFDDDDYDDCYVDESNNEAMTNSNSKNNMGEFGVDISNSNVLPRKVRKCGFCSKAGHNQSSCPSKAILGREMSKALDQRHNEINQFMQGAFVNIDTNRLRDAKTAVNNKCKFLSIRSV